MAEEPIPIPPIDVSELSDGAALFRAAIHRTVAESQGRVQRKKEKIAEVQKEAAAKRRKTPFGRKKKPAPDPAVAAAILAKPDVAKPPKKGRVGRGVKALCEDGIKRNISECWQEFFRLNEVLPLDQRMNDRVILEKMRELFPSRETRHFTDIARVRAAYNRGMLPGMQSPPEVRSCRYEKYGDDWYEVGPRGAAKRRVAEVVYKPKVTDERDTSSRTQTGPAEGNGKPDAASPNSPGAPEQPSVPERPETRGGGEEASGGRPLGPEPSSN